MLWGLFILMGAAYALLVVVGTAVVAWVMAHPPRRTVGVAVAQGLPADPGDAGLEYETFTFTDASGAAVEAWSVAGGDADGPVVVMLHGWGDSRIGMLLWHETVAGSASRFVCFDQRGHGESPHARFMWGEAERDDVLCLVDALHEGDAGRPVVLMGFSMGSAVAVDAAATACSNDADADRVAGVMLDSPYRHIEDVTRRMMAVQRVPAWPWVSLAVSVLRAAGATEVGRWDTAKRASAVTCPLLVLHGGQDRVTPPSDARAIVEASPAARLVEFPDAAHIAGACADPQRYAAEVATFLRDSCQQSA